MLLSICILCTYSMHTVMHIECICPVCIKIQSIERDICHRRVTVKDTPQKFTNSVMLPEVKISCKLRDFLFSIRPRTHQEKPLSWYFSTPNAIVLNGIRKYRDMKIGGKR